MACDVWKMASDLWKPTSAALIGAILTLVGPAPTVAQIPDTFTNLQYLPEDVSRDSLIAVMRSFSFALGVRCQYCHAGGDGVSFEGVEFDSDEKIEKRRARYMLEMVDRINEELLPKLPGYAEVHGGGEDALAGPADHTHVRVECRTCHRGLPRPRMIDDILVEKIEQEGVEAAIAHYQELREQNYGGWSYDFGEWTMNDLAQELARAGEVSAAIAILQMNSEYYPQSPSVWGILGHLYATDGQRQEAIASFRKAVELDPENDFLRQRLTQLEGES